MQQCHCSTKQKYWMGEATLAATEKSLHSFADLCLSFSRDLVELELKIEKKLLLAEKVSLMQIYH